ncbi:hypothetical protein ACXZ1M_06415 [Duganella sp. PWIR1]
MEARITKLEEFAAETNIRLAKIEARLELMATKADLEEKIGALRVEMHKGFADMIKWVVGTAIVLGGTGLTVITFVLNNAVPKAPPPAPQPPVIVYAQPAPAPAPQK